MLAKSRISFFNYYILTGSICAFIGATKIHGKSFRPVKCSGFCLSAQIIILKYTSFQDFPVKNLPILHISLILKPEYAIRQTDRTSRAGKSACISVSGIGCTLPDITASSIHSATKGNPMKLYSSCNPAILSCMDTQSFAVAHLYNDDRPTAIHIHDCYEIYYSISGGKQFLVDNRFYDFRPGDIFFINQYESHCLSQLDNIRHERIMITIHPEFLKKLSTEKTDLDYCFSYRSSRIGHRISLSPEEQKRFLYFIHKLSGEAQFGQELLDHAAFLEMMVFLTQCFTGRCHQEAADCTFGTVVSHHKQMDQIISFINLNLTEDLTLQMLADHFFLSTSYLCRLFRESTGTTINRYITARRITRAKALLSEGYSVTETCSMCGFRDYSNFLKAFTKAVGISPKKYAQFS